MSSTWSHRSRYVVGVSSVCGSIGGGGGRGAAAPTALGVPLAQSALCVQWRCVRRAMCPKGRVRVLLWL